MTTSLDRDESVQPQANLFSDEIKRLISPNAKTEAVTSEEYLLLQYYVNQYHKSDQALRVRMRDLQNDLCDVLELIKMVHYIMVNQDCEMSPYEDDPKDALFSSISFLREKTAKLEQDFTIEKVFLPDNELSNHFT